jgi:hypothetical protein
MDDLPKLGGADQPGLQKIDFRPSVHLAFHQLELRDLSFGLAVRPRLGDGGTDRGFVPNDAAGKGRDQADTGRGNPWIEIGDELLAQHGLEPIDEGAGFDERWHARLDGGNRDGIQTARLN